MLQNKLSGMVSIKYDVGLQNVMDLKPKAFKIQRQQKKVNILKTTIETHHDMYWIVNVIVFIYNIYCVK